MATDRAECVMDRSQVILVVGVAILLPVAVATAVSERRSKPTRTPVEASPSTRNGVAAAERARGELKPLLDTRRPEVQQQLEATIATYVTQEFLTKFDVPNHQAYLDTKLWAMMNVEQKTQAAAALAYYCGWRNGNDSNWVELRDPFTDKRLGKYSEAWGFTVY